MATDTPQVTPAADSPSVSRDTRIRLLHLMLLQRLVEDRVMAMYRQGRIVGSVYTGRGQEAVGAAAGLALGPHDVAAPLNREQACHYARGVTVGDVLSNFLGKATGPTRGRDGNMHFGKRQVDVFPLVSMLGTLVPVTVGAALAFKRRREPRVALTFMGDGQFCVGDVHEGLNLAGVLHVPAVFVVQNNQYAYSTPTSHEMLNPNISERIRAGWNIPCARVDGTDAVTTYEAIRDAVERARAGEGPQAVEATTLRGHGHAAHDDARYVPDELRARFADPIDRLLARLRSDGLSESELDDVLARAQDEVAAGLAEAEAAPFADPAEIEDGVYASPISHREPR